MDNEQALIDAGFIITPNIYFSGKGNGKVYGKSFDNYAPFTDANVEGGKHYEYYSVDTDGTVAPWHAQINVVATQEEIAPVVAEEVAIDAPATPEVITEEETIDAPVVDAPAV